MFYRTAKWLLFSAVTLSFLAVIGCKTRTQRIATDTSVVTPQYAVRPKRINVTTHKGLKKLERDLRKNGVHIVRQGEDFTVIISSDQLFTGRTPHFYLKAYDLLDYLAAFIRNCDTVQIEVAAYTDDKGPITRDLALTRQQAKNVANYLWSQDLDVRLITSKGMGEKTPIATNLTRDGQRENRRVEVKFRIIPKTLA